MKPLLTICIPTYNRARFLRVTLEALLPQVAEVPDDVEVWVIDNASPDETPSVIEQVRHLGVFHYHRQPENLGAARALTYGPCELASGEFAWVVGDHNLFRPGALHQVIKTLRERRNLDLLYANFRCATYPEHWPEEAIGGYNGNFHYIGNPRTAEGGVARWSDLIDGRSALCTQSYAHIVKTGIWQNYWRDRPMPQAHSDGPSSYPHTWMLAETCLGSPSYYIAEPMITIFNGAQSWGNPESQARIYYLGLPDLIRLFEKRGISGDTVSEARGFNAVQARQVASALMRRVGVRPWAEALRWLRAILPKDRYLVRPFVDGFCDSGATRISRLVLRGRGLLTSSAQLARRVHSYLFRHCRPARWWRNRRI